MMNIFTKYRQFWVVVALQSKYCGVMILNKINKNRVLNHAPFWHTNNIFGRVALFWHTLNIKLSIY